MAKYTPPDYVIDQAKIIRDLKQILVGYYGWPPVPGNVRTPDALKAVNNYVKALLEFGPQELKEDK